MAKKEVTNINLEELLLMLSPIEKTILPFLQFGDIKEIAVQAKLDLTSVKRALQFLANKDIVRLNIEKKKFVKHDVNGILYLKKNLPERRLLNLLVEAKVLDFDSAKKQAKLSDNEFRVSLGILKEKQLANIASGKVSVKIGKEEAMQKLPEEKFLEVLPLELDLLNKEQKILIKKLQARKTIIRIDEETKLSFEVTELGHNLIDKLPKFKKEILEQLTPEMLKKSSWKGKIFRKYDIQSKAPEIYGGKRHFVNQAADYARKIWLEMGFREMTGNLVQTTFWNFDALFTAQDHPVREMQDTFYIKDIEAKLPDKKLVKAVRETHEKGTKGSKGWQYKWDEMGAKKVVLRTHTTCLSAKTLSQLAELKNKSGKFFAIGKCFRNETLDWSHGFEFNQTEGIVVDERVNFRHLLGYLREFYKKMGFEKIRFTPAYFPYTEPSVEMSAFHTEKKVWLELGGAGILRPEVVIPLLGEYIPVLAWGPGFDRTIMDYYKISDLREMYQNNLNKIRKMKFWMK